MGGSLQGMRSEVTTKKQRILACLVHSHSCISALFCSDREPVPGDSDFGLFWKATSTLSVSIQKNINPKKCVHVKSEKMLNNNSGEKMSQDFYKT